MSKRRRNLLAGFNLVFFLWISATVQAQIDDSCVISVLNRTAPVAEDGTWVLPNIPAGTGPVRLRATCVREGVVTSGESPLVEIPRDGILRVSEIDFAGVGEGPERLDVVAPPLAFTSVGETQACEVFAVFPDGRREDVTSVDHGTTFTSSNAGILSAADGCTLTAAGSGLAIVSALYDGVVGLLAVQLTLSGDTDGDGLPDDWEVANGLDPSDPGDALLDPDRDGLSTLEEFQGGLDPFDADTDDDGLVDGEEVVLHGTNPLLFDTDGDGLSDGLEIQTGSDPLDRNSFNLAAALTSIDVAPEVFTIFFNSALGEASRQLVVTGQLIDGNQLDVTSTFYGTGYSSSDLSIANFGADPGRVYAGSDGTAVVTAAVAGFSAQATVEVTSFAPTALSYLPMSGRPRAVTLSGPMVYAAMDRGGLKVVDVSDPAVPFLVSTFFPVAAGASSSSAVRDVVVNGGLAYLAADDAGLVIADVGNPGSVQQLSSLLPAGSPGLTVAVEGSLALLGSTSSLAVIDVGDPASPILLGSVALSAAAQHVEISGGVAWVALGAEGLAAVDVSDPAQPRIVGRTHLRPNERSRSSGLALLGQQVVLADGGSPRSLGGLRVVDGSVPQAPIVVGTTSDQFGLVKVATDDFGLALAADYFFRNAVPIFHLGSGNPLFREVLDFSLAPSFRDDDGVDLAVEDGLVYLLARHWYYGDGGLHIGRYLQPNDTAGISPTVEVVGPDGSAPVKERRRIIVTAEAEDDIYLRSVEIIADGVSLGRDFLPPYQAELVVPVGQTAVELSAVALDAGGNMGTSHVVTVPIDSDAAPAVAIRSPLLKQEVPERVRIPLVVEASDDSAIDRVEIFVDGGLLETLTEEPYTTSYLVPDDAPQRVFTAIAFDDFGGSTTSDPVTIAVRLDLPPEVLIVEPTEGTEVVEGTELQILVGATDDVGVERVSFFVNGSQVALDPIGPPWSRPVTLPAVMSPFAILAVARDTDGQETISAAVAVTIVEDPLTTVAGLVVDPQGDPVSGAVVEVTTGANTKVSNSSLLDGSFEVSGIPTNEGELEVEATATVGGEPSAASVPEPSLPNPGGVVDVGVLGLESVTTVTTLIGSVEDPAGNPVAGALVRVHNRYEKLETVTLVDGTFRFERVPLSTNDASGSSPFLRLYVSAFADVGGGPHRGKPSGLFFPVPDATTNAGILTLEPVPASDPGTTAIGTVVDEEEIGIAGADVAVSTDYDLLLTTTDTLGDFSLAGVPALDGDLFVTAEASRFGELVTTPGQGPQAPVAEGVTDLGFLEFPPEGGCGDEGCG